MNGNKLADVVTFGNLKGGTGKTTNCTMIAYELSKLGYKVLLVDHDPQSNSTELYLKTKAREEDEIVTFNKTLMTAIVEKDLAQIITKIKDNLYILPSFSDFAIYPFYLEKLFPGEDGIESRVKYLKTLIDPLKKDYDFIFIDVPPTESLFTHGALYASDYVIIILQTHERSYAGALSFIEYLQRDLINKYNADIEILGVIPVLLKSSSTTDQRVLKRAIDYFGEGNMFKTIIKTMDRLKTFDNTGITDSKSDPHDKKVHKKYTELSKEFIEKLNELKG